jgi:hypothetical protein
MNILSQRRERPQDYRSDRYERQRLSELKQERCGVCTDDWPASMMLTEDGLRRCPDCSDNGRSREEKAQIQSADNARRAGRQTRQQVPPIREESVAFIRSMEDASGNAVLRQSAPLVLVRNGAAVTLVITGGGFLSTDSFTYSTGITDETAPALTGSTVWTLSLVADGTATPGDNHLTFNNRTYRNLLRVG